MNVTTAPHGTVLCTSLALGDSADLCTNSIGMARIRFETGNFPVPEDGLPPEDNVGHHVGGGISRSKDLPPPPKE